MFKHILRDVLHGLFFPAFTVRTVVKDDGRAVPCDDDISGIAGEPGRLHLGDNTAETELAFHPYGIDLRNKIGAHQVFRLAEDITCVPVDGYGRTHQPEHMMGKYSLGKLKG
jgi:hypothetical protein